MNIAGEIYVVRRRSYVTMHNKSTSSYALKDDKLFVISYHCMISRKIVEETTVNKQK